MFSKTFMRLPYVLVIRRISLFDKEPSIVFGLDKDTFYMKHDFYPHFRAETTINFIHEYKR